MIDRLSYYEISARIWGAQNELEMWGWKGIKKKKLYLLAAEDLLGLVDLLVTEETENCRWRIIKRLNIYLSS